MKLPKLFKPAASAKPLRGFIDAHADGMLAGWAFDPGQADRRLEVEAWVGGKPCGTGLAETFRDDLLKNGIGDGRHGFHFRLATELRAGESAEVHLVDAASGQRIPANTFKITRAASRGLRIAGVEDGQLVGQIETASPDGAEPTLYLLLDDGPAVAGVPARREEGRVTFRLPIPREAFDGMPHLLVAGVEGEPGVEAAWLDVLPGIQTPWTYLASSAARNGYAALPRTAGYRYESLRLHTEAALGPDARPDALQRLRAVSAAHAVVVEGYEDRRRFPRLSLPPVDDPLVSIVIPVHDKYELTYHCLASLILACNEASFEAIVVDDCSSDRTTELAGDVENVRLIVNDSNLGFLLSCNKGAAAARGRYVVMLNNDTEVTSGWLDELIDAFTRFPRVGMAGSKLLYPDGRLQEAGGIVWGNGAPWNLGRGQNPRHPSYNYARQSDYLSGAALMLPRAVWERVGGFSEEFAPAYYEDTDLAFKVRAAGYRTYYVPFSEVVHFEGMSNGRDVSSGIKRHQLLNEPKFRAKWFDAYRHNGKVCEDLTLNMDRGIAHRVLMIDHSVPRPDQDAGSHAAVQEIRMLQANGCKITFVPENMAHLGKYTDDLQRMGVECICAPFYVSIEELLQQRGGDFDLVYITRYDVAERQLPAVRRLTRAKVLFNNADLHFLRELRAALAARSTDLSGPLATRDRELALMRQVDAILSYNATEHAVIASHNLRDDNLFLCPWVTDFKGHRTPFAGRSGIAFLGGYRHKPNVEAVQFFVREVMPLLRRAHPGVRFHVYGSSVPAELEALAADDVVIEGFVETLDEVFETCRIFVAPLVSGAGLKGKVVEAASYAVPSVLSPVAAEGTGLTGESMALIASTPTEWVQAIGRLYHDEALWNEMSANLAAFVKRAYSLDNGVRQMRRPLSYLGLFVPQEFVNQGGGGAAS
ncbi:MAG: glycosyltransferase [Burkholderiales bacterium]|nr:glycosyltransferase [Burkholderiales bacterium]